MQAKNRYSDVLCLDQSRVRLTTAVSDELYADYINANFVDGYKQRNAYISTQGWTNANHKCMLRFARSSVYMCLIIYPLLIVICWFVKVLCQRHTATFGGWCGSNGC